MTTKFEDYPSVAVTVRRTIHPEVRVLDEKEGLVEYIASDETLDSYKEIIRAEGWRFNLFKKNSPFVDSHDYRSIDRLLGKVIEARIDRTKKRLVETVQWAKDASELAALGWRLTAGGFLKAVSVGFWPVRYASAMDADWKKQLAALGLDPASADLPRRIYLEQEQVELSACVLGANPSAVALAYKAQCIGDNDLDFLSKAFDHASAHAAMNPYSADAPRIMGRAEFLRRFETAVQRATGRTSR